MTAHVVNLKEYRKARSARTAIGLSEKNAYICVPAPGGGYAWFPRSEFTAEELADIDFFKKECGL